ncbi:hypothetical protein ASPZODRAFT_144343 [Penicilliopsis zonata CBS 506.65]|uniref:Cadmium resistance transporter n=1 Tax=Penicilliopsis zonata CBS 506.65 TaxID=1073090 RepID=A0A1L9SCY9_9EURO|nr:hypothetical protein ASPZODRAFT_144343 [Penicilliopsis zonata CBS 506.65]OJJ45031.1 hypothetical protein ASPZODRAFT_144343 [Penicilliopsis zonata CBS 506.65]
MQFGKSIGTACSSFAITNIDDLFVLTTFFAEAATSPTLTPVKITVGQYVGFTVIVIISMIGFGASLVLPSEPIGFLGLLPILLGVWKLIDLLLPTGEGEENAGQLPDGQDGQDGGEKQQSHFLSSLKSILKVSMITVMNGGDNIGTYIPLFAQAKGPEIAIYVVTYYILLGLWCLAAFLIMKQRHVLRLAQRYADRVVPFLYMGLGMYIIIKSSCYPWSIKRIDVSSSSHPGKAIMAVVTTVLLLICIAAMLWRAKVKRGRLCPNGAEIEHSSDS